MPQLLCRVASAPLTVWLGPDSVSALGAMGANPALTGSSWLGKWPQA